MTLITGHESPLAVLRASIEAAHRLIKTHQYYIDTYNLTPETLKIQHAIVQRYKFFIYRMEEYLSG